MSPAQSDYAMCDMVRIIICYVLGPKRIRLPSSVQRASVKLSRPLLTVLRMSRQRWGVSLCLSVQVCIR